MAWDMMEPPDYDKMDDDALEHRYQIDIALRILMCPRHDCRRRKACLDPTTCPGLARVPVPRAIEHMRIRRTRRLLEERYRAIEAGPEASAALKKRWAQEKLRDRDKPKPDYLELARKELERRSWGKEDG